MPNEDLRVRDEQRHFTPEHSMGRWKHHCTNAKAGPVVLFQGRQTRNAAQLERELESELDPDHVLKGQKMQAIAEREDCDDVLFVGVTNTKLVAVVHLTYANRPENNDPRYPETTMFASLEEWAEKSGHAQ